VYVSSSRMICLLSEWVGEVERVVRAEEEEEGMGPVEVREDEMEEEGVS
jgi:hypothetical protein